MAQLEGERKRLIEETRIEVAKSNLAMQQRINSFGSNKPPDADVRSNKKTPS